MGGAVRNEVRQGEGVVLGSKLLSLVDWIGFFLMLECCVAKDFRFAIGFE